MTTYTLILFFYIFSNGNNSTANIPGFISEKECIEAGVQAESLLVGPRDAVQHGCVKQTVMVKK